MLAAHWPLHVAAQDLGYQDHHLMQLLQKRQVVSVLLSDGSHAAAVVHG
jgi:hypothetical protein